MLELEVSTAQRQVELTYEIGIQQSSDDSKVLIIMMSASRPAEHASEGLHSNRKMLLR